MVYDPWKNIWVDIYLQSGTDENTKSAYGVPITTNRSYSDHHVDFSSVNKRFLTSDEFRVLHVWNQFGNQYYRQ
ncbi:MULTISPECIES: hypothetical protein [unclassified Bartonella]